MTVELDNPLQALLKRLDDLELKLQNIQAEIKMVKKELYAMLHAGPYKYGVPAFDDLRESTEQVFTSLSNRWHEETDDLSSPSRITSNESYLRIISLGKEVIPLILRDLQDRGGDWYLALRILADDNPVPPEHEGYSPLMDEDWLTWGREHHQIGLR